MTENDSDVVSICCAFDQDDNDIGKEIANDFLLNFTSYCTNSSICNLGLFDENRLLGIVQGVKDEILNITTINVFVNRKYRKKGYAKRLVSTICSVSSDTIYCYSCIKWNTSSIATAKSCGFIFKGAYIFIK